MANNGYTGKILRVDLTAGKTTDVPTKDYSDKFLGGRGIAAKVYWDETPAGVSALDAENVVTFATGPIGGVPVFAGSRWTVCGKIPSVERFSYGNFGGRWGAELKFAGYDAITVHGKSEKPVYLFLHDGTAELRDASDLWGRGAIESREILKGELDSSVRVAAIGQGGENMVVMGNIIADNDAAGSKGLGAVLGSKMLKAVAVKGKGEKVKFAQPERVKELTEHVRNLKHGFPYYDEAFHHVLSRWAYDPRLDFRLVPDAEEVLKKQPCYGCLGHCARMAYRAKDGNTGKFICHSAYIYQPWAEQYYGDWNDVPFQATKLCDNYGLDTIETDLIISWLNECYKAGILTDENTGIPLSKVGSEEYIKTLTRKISMREGFGEILAQGVNKAAAEVGTAAIEQLENVGLTSAPGWRQPYGPRLYFTAGLLYAMEPRMPVYLLHEIGTTISHWLTCHMGLNTWPTTQTLRAIAEKFWGSELAADFSTYEGKALAAKKIQDRGYAKECLILCDWLWPMMHLEFSEDHIGDPSLESKIVSAVTGNELDEEGLNRIGERVFNLWRAINVRDGHKGREYDRISEQAYTVPLDYDMPNAQCLLPGKDGEVISRKGEVVDREQFEKMKDEYYQLRQWDVATGLQTKSQLDDLGLKEVAQELQKKGLLAPVT
jgi:aldehyde:ferredoxin oxidoreductase